MVVVRSLSTCRSMPAGAVASSAGQLRLDVVDRGDDVGARQLEHREDDRLLAVGPGGELVVLRRVDRRADVAHPHRRAVAEGEDGVEPGLGGGELVVVVDGEGAVRPVHDALGVVHREVDDGLAHVFQPEAEIGDLGRVDLDADGGLLLAEHQHLADAVDLADVLLQYVLGIVVDLGDRQRVRGQRQHQDRRVGGVHLAIGGRRRQVGRQLPAGGVDRRLHQLRSGVDVHAELELQRDRRIAQRRHRGHLRQAGNLAELPLQRLRHRGGDDLRAGAGKLGRDLQRREVDLRQRRHRQAREAGDAEDQQPRHQQRGADGVADEP